MSESLSVVIPAFNEEACIGECITTLETVLRQVTTDFEVIVVNDGSHDRTAAILEELGASRPYLVTVHHDRNRGLGASLRSGFSRCRKSLTFYSDADLPFDFVELVRAVRVMRFKTADVVTAFRHDRTSEGLKRILYSFAYNWLIRAVFGLKTDVTSTYGRSSADITVTLPAGVTRGIAGQPPDRRGRSARTSAPAHRAHRHRR